MTSRWMVLGLVLVLSGLGCPPGEDDGTDGGGDDDDAGGSALIGYMTLVSHEDVALGCVGSLSGGFWIDASWSEEVFSYGACLVHEYPVPTPDYIDAGTVLLTGLPGGQVPIEKAPEGPYYPVDVPCDDWGPDTPLSVASAAGGEFGPFALGPVADLGETPTLLSPAMAPFVQVTPGQDLALEFAPYSGDVEVRLVTYNMDLTEAYDIRCVYSEQTDIVVPGEALDHLEGIGTGMGFFFVQRAAVVEAVDPARDITFEVQRGRSGTFVIVGG